MQEEIKLVTETKKGTLVKVPTTIERVDGRIYFLKSPFALKDEIKAMQGSRWHGRIPEDGRKIWSVADCCRNNFQLDFMQGGNPYANWEKPLKEFGYSRSLYTHQKLMANHGLTYHYKILAAEMGVGKTLAAIEIMEKSGVLDWWWVAPKSGLAAVEREFEKWGLKLQPKLMTYDRLRIDIEKWEDGMPAPQGIFFDESQKLKTSGVKRQMAAQHIADAVRMEWGWEGFVIPMTGTPSPKSPKDWWAQCEVCYPGFLKEGSAKAFEQRLAIFQKQMTSAGEFWKRVTWRDNEEKCDVCGQFEDHANHLPDSMVFGEVDEHHEFVPSKNEVAYLFDRLDGLALPLKKKDCLDIPDIIYREIVLEPSSTLKRVAKALVKSASTAIEGITWLRELSDGFQYKYKQEGTKVCSVCKGTGECEQWTINPQTEDTEKVLSVCEVCGGDGEVAKMVRETKELKTPKDQAVRDLLEENEDQGRLVIFAGFQGSIDKITKICHKQQWNVVQVDGRGWKIFPCDDEKVGKIKPLDYWANDNVARVAFVAHPASGGVGLTLTEARMAVFYSNDFSPENRMQAEPRIHRPGMDINKGATIVDLFHLGTDKKILDILRDNRRLENMTLGEMQEMVNEL